MTALAPPPPSAKARDDAGSSSPSSGSSPVVRADRVATLARSIEQPFTVGTLVRAAERDRVAISRVLAWMREAEHRGDISDTGARRGSGTALRGSRLYRTTA